METALVEFVLCEKLHIQACKSSRDNIQALSVKLNNGYKMLLEPAALGFSGTTLWFGRSAISGKNPEGHNSRSELQVNVTLVRVTVDGDLMVSAFAGHAANIEQLLVESLAKIEEFCSLRLVPLPIVAVEQETQVNKLTNQTAISKGDDNHPKHN